MLPGYGDVIAGYPGGMALSEDYERRSRSQEQIQVRGARVHNLRGIDVDIPLHSLVAIAGVSGSGKSSLALGVLYAEGSRRYLEALSTYSRRRMAQAPRAQVDSVTHIPAALALRQRPPVPNARSTFGTMTELLNVVRLMFSRLGSHLCRNGHRIAPTVDVAAERDIHCPECGVVVNPPSAEELSFNAGGACPTCAGLGVVRVVDDATLVPDESLSIDEGAVVPWQTFGFKVQPDIVREFGVRTDVAFAQLSEAEREIVFRGPEEKKHIAVKSKKGVHDLDFTYRNARLTVIRELERADTEKRLAKVSRFLTESTCNSCHGSRLNPAALAPLIDGQSLAQVSSLSLEALLQWADELVEKLPEEMGALAAGLAETLSEMARRLIELGLGYLTLDRAGASLSTGERQRTQLARALRNRTTGLLYVLDEPSIGLHPANTAGLLGVMRDLVAEGNSVVFVDHDVQLLAAADWLVEVGPGSGAAGGTIIASARPDQLRAERGSRIADFVHGRYQLHQRPQADSASLWAAGAIELDSAAIHTVQPAKLQIPLERLSAITGVSGSGKTTLVLETLVPALTAAASGSELPAHVNALSVPRPMVVQLVDASPIGHNIRSTVATYTGIMDELRRAYARTRRAHEAGLTAADFSYNTGSLACPRCSGAGEISLDVQFLPDIDITCPECEGSRYAPRAGEFTREGISLPELLSKSVREARPLVAGVKKVSTLLADLDELGLGYLQLGEATPALSGGEAQRLKLVSALTKQHSNTVFVLDEPSVGLHPLDVHKLLAVLQRLLDQSATVVVIEHDLDMIANADYVVDMGPHGGESGGRIIARGTPAEIAAATASVTGKYLRHLLSGNDGAIPGADDSAGDRGSAGEARLAGKQEGEGESEMADKHPEKTPGGSSVKDGEVYQSLRQEGASKQKAAAIANAAANSSRAEVGKKGGRAGSYEDWTVAELTERARELEITGRSTMNKEELIKALREH